MRPCVITAKFEIITPMFLGGGDQQVLRIRETSIKGAIVFWWRALNYARFVMESSGCQDDALQKMQMEERKLFGGPEGQGAFLLKVTRQPNTPPICSNSILKESSCQVVGPGARYMAGQGVFNGKNTTAGKLNRSCFSAPDEFHVEIIFKSSKREAIIKDLLPALKLFGLVGGLGSRVRRGWGSVALKELSGDCDTASLVDIKDAASYEDALSKLIKSQKSRLPSPEKWPEGKEFQVSSFSGESRIWITDKRCSKNREEVCDKLPNDAPDAIWSSGLEALDWLGRAFLNYRAWGKNGTVEKMPVQQQFIEDHNWFFNIDPKVDIPYRTAFGLPHKYSKFCGVSVNDGSDGRRASPMFFHVHKVGDGYIGVVLIFPTAFIIGDITAKPKAGAAKTKGYSLSEKYGGEGGREASGHEVLLGFIENSGPFTPNKLLLFKEVDL